MVRLGLFIIASLVSLSALAAEFSSSVDRTQLQLNEPLLFTLTLTNSDIRLRAEGVNANVDLTLLSDNFTLGRPEASNNYNIYLGQGRATSEIKVELFPKRTGQLTIPAFSIDGLSTAPIMIEVLSIETTISEEVFVRSGSNIKSAWVGQQIVAYIDLYHRVELESASLGSNFETEPVQIELLSNWKMPQDSRKEIAQGLEYEVERIAWAVFPNQAGDFTVQLPDIWVTTKAGNKLRLPHQRIDFQINALPAELPGDIIIGKPELSAAPLPSSFTQHELSPWTLTLKAPVGVTALPRHLPGIELPEGLKLYPDPARYRSEQSSAGIMDVADYTLSIMPLRAGEFKLPSIRIPYFDPNKGEAALVELASQSINVAAATKPTPASVLTDDVIAAAAAETNQEMSSSWTWQLTTAIMTLLWLTTLLKLWRKQNATPLQPQTSSSTVTNPKDTRYPLQQKLLQAMGSKTLEQGLQQWTAQQPKDKTVPEAIKVLQQYCYGRGEVSESDLETLVANAIKKIKATPIQVASNEDNPWQAQNFYPVKKHNRHDSI